MASTHFSKCAIVVAAASLGFASNACAQAVFTGLGDLTGGNDFSVARGVSSDGTVVCGASSSTASGTRSEAIKWTSSGGMVAIGDLPGGVYSSSGAAISDNGSTIVGHSSSSNASWPNTEGFYWTSGGGMTGIGINNTYSPAKGVSGDGTALVGITVPGTATQGYVWTSSNGFTNLGLLSGDSMGFAYDADEDGSLVVGFATTNFGQKPRKWTSAGGWASLFTGYGAALSITADASTVTGRYGKGNAQEPLLWTSAGASGVGNASGTDAGTGWDIADDDANVIVGTAQLVNTSDYVAIIWIEDQGTFQLKSWLEDNFGLDLSGWTLENARGVSDNGLVIVGHGENSASDTEGFHVELPWLDCPADWNKDGLLNTSDILDFLSDYNAGDADFNGDGTTNTQDWIDFLNAYNAGC